MHGCKSVLATLSRAASTRGTSISLINLDYSGNKESFHIHVGWNPPTAFMHCFVFHPHNSHQFSCSPTLESPPLGDEELAAVCFVCHTQSTRWPFQPIPVPSTLIMFITGPSGWPGTSVFQHDRRVLDMLVFRQRNHSMPERHCHGHGWMWPEVPKGIWCPIRTRSLKKFYTWVKKEALKFSLAHTILTEGVEGSLDLMIC